MIYIVKKNINKCINNLNHQTNLFKVLAGERLLRLAATLGESSSAIVLTVDRLFNKLSLGEGTSP